MDAVAAGSFAIAALRGFDGGTAGDVQLVVAVDAVAAGAIGRSAAGSLLYLAAGDGEFTVGADAVAAENFAFTALRGSDGATGDGELTGADAVAAVLLGIAAGGVLDSGVLGDEERTGAVDAGAAGVTGGLTAGSLLYLAAGDGELVHAADAAAAGSSAPSPREQPCSTAETERRKTAGARIIRMELL